MDSIRELVRLAVVAGGCIVIAAAPAAAGAKPAKKKKGPGAVFVVSASAPIAASSTATADAYCPKRSNVTGGGFEVGPEVGQSGPFPIESHRMFGRAWRVVAGEGPDAQTGSVSSFAVCQKRAKKLAFVSATVQLQLTNPPTVTAQDIGVSCPPPSHSVAGGFAGQADITQGATLPQGSVKDGNQGWVNSGFYIGDPERGPATRPFTSIAYCAQSGRTAQSASAPVPALGSASVLSPPCSRPALSGGFGVNPIVSSAVVPYASKPAASGWQASGAELFGGDGEITAVAYCAS